MYKPNLPSVKPIADLIDAACQRHEARIVANTLCAQRPCLESLPQLAAIDPETLHKVESALFAQTTKELADYRHALTHTAGPLERWLEATDEDIRALAMRYAARKMPGTKKLAWASALLGTAIPGTCIESQLARLNNARFWRRAIRTVLRRERERVFLRLKLVGRAGEPYVSTAQVLTRLAQLQRQKRWMQQTVLVPRDLKTGETYPPLTLEAVAGDPRTRFAKLYTFIKAIESLALDAGLVSALVTLTAPPEWHPNPSHGADSWNDASPREAHQHIAKAWHALQIELYKKGIGISGLRVVEPHKDGCPHWHVWLVYRPEVEKDILATLMNHFPGKLKLRRPVGKGQKPASNDCMYDTRADVLADKPRALTTAKEGARVEVSRIDPKISSAATYLMKYLLKTVDGGEPLAKEVDLFGEGATTHATEDEQKAAAKKRGEHQRTVEQVDAWRSLWSINAAMLFGVARCLGAWDELRRLAAPPDNAMLFRLWVLARGSDKPGRVAAGSKQRGDAKGFLEALGGITAARDPRDKSLVPSLRLARLTEPGENVYGEPIKRPKGVQLIKTVDCKEEVPGKRANRTRTFKSTLQVIVAAVVTRLMQWRLMRLVSNKSKGDAAHHGTADSLSANPSDSPFFLEGKNGWVKREVVPIPPPRRQYWQIPLPDML